MTLLAPLMRWRATSPWRRLGLVELLVASDGLADYVGLLSAATSNREGASVLFLVWGRHAEGSQGLGYFGVIDLALGGFVEWFLSSCG